MRVIGGSARSVPLAAPPGREIRPTLDRVREALFNILGPHVAGARFLDLYAGTGANGIEALSRGATSAVFVDKARVALATIEKNLAKTRLADRGQRLRLDFPREAGRIGGEFELIFADPPFSGADYGEIIAAVVAQGLLARGGVLVVEHPAKAVLPEVSGPLRRYREAVYGGTVLSFYT